MPKPARKLPASVWEEINRLRVESNIQSLSETGVNLQPTQEISGLGKFDIDNHRLRSLNEAERKLALYHQAEIRTTHLPRTQLNIKVAGGPRVSEAISAPSLWTPDSQPGTAKRVSMLKNILHNKAARTLADPTSAKAVQGAPSTYYGKPLEGGQQGARPGGEIWRGNMGEDRRIVKPRKPTPKGLRPTNPYLPETENFLRFSKRYPRGTPITRMSSNISAASKPLEHIETAYVATRTTRGDFSSFLERTFSDPNFNPSTVNYREKVFADRYFGPRGSPLRKTHMNAWKAAIQRHTGLSSAGVVAEGRKFYGKSVLNPKPERFKGLQKPSAIMDWAERRAEHPMRVLKPPPRRLPQMSPYLQAKGRVGIIDPHEFRARTEPSTTPFPMVKHMRSKDILNRGVTPLNPGYRGLPHGPDFKPRVIPIRHPPPAPAVLRALEGTYKVTKKTTIPAARFVRRASRGVGVASAAKTATRFAKGLGRLRSMAVPALLASLALEALSNDE